LTTVANWYNHLRKDQKISFEESILPTLSKEKSTVIKALSLPSREIFGDYPYTKTAVQSLHHEFGFISLAILHSGLLELESYLDKKVGLEKYSQYCKYLNRELLGNGLRIISRRILEVNHHITSLLEVISSLSKIHLATEKGLYIL